MPKDVGHDITFAESENVEEHAGRLWQARTGMAPFKLRIESCRVPDVPAELENISLPLLFIDDTPVQVEVEVRILRPGDAKQFAPIVPILTGPTEPREMIEDEWAGGAFVGLVERDGRLRIQRAPARVQLCQRGIPP